MDSQEVGGPEVSVATQPQSSIVTRGEDSPYTPKNINRERRLFVGNLPSTAKTEDIRDFFSHHGYEM